MNNDIVLELKGVSKIYRDENNEIFKAVNNVDIVLRKGECVGIVGESGSGKSTLAKIIAHLINADEGKILYKGEDNTILNKKRIKDYYKSMQMIFQDPLATFSPRMKVGKYLLEPFVNYKIMNKADAVKYIENILELVGLEADCMKKYPTELSGGQLQRVVIARAVGMNPEIIISDECTSALDVSIQEKIIDLLMDLKDKRDYSSIFITHDLALAENICDRIYVMKRGQVVDLLKGGCIVESASHDYTKTLLEAVM